MGDRDESGARYRAFLSYSHKDGAAAGRLHRRLEAYRIPKRLTARETVRGPVPRRLMPIFRDREELPAATDLSETVREALAQSGALIVLCSPNAAGSLWVAEEIRVFRELHPGRPILAAILDGDPPACFPPVLREMGDGHEPLATDLRRTGDGERLGLLKLVAGITGLGLDDLVQRDATRRVRRVMAVTAAAVLVALSMAALALLAVTARREAERQRAEAEGQIEFMLTDLRNRLRTVGRLDIMEAVNERAFRYYQGPEELGGLPASSELRRARTLHAIGEDYLNTSRYDRALVVFREAQRATAAQLAQAPDDPQTLRDHGRSESWIGRVHELRREWPQALAQYRTFASLAERLNRVAPGNPDYMKELAWSHVNLGNVQLANQDPVGAQASYERAVQWFERVAAASPRDPNGPRILGNAYGWLADTYYMRALYRQSLEARLRQYRLIEPLHRADPANVDTSYRFALAQRGVGASYIQLGNREAARAPLIDAYEISVRLIRHDPRNAEWLLFHGMMGCQLYFGRFPLPPGVTQARLRTEVQGVSQGLTAQHNPRAADLSRCLNAMTGQRAAHSA